MPHYSHYASQKSGHPQYPQFTVILRPLQANASGIKAEDSSIKISLSTDGTPVTLGASKQNGALGAEVQSHQAASTLIRGHAELMVRAEKVYVRDLGSKSSTFVNGERLSYSHTRSELYQLHTGDTMSLASSMYSPKRDHAQDYNARVELSISSSPYDWPEFHTRGYAVLAAAFSRVTAWLTGNPGSIKAPICWFSHPDESLRTSMSMRIARHCNEQRLEAPCIYLSRRLASDWDIIEFLVCQLCVLYPSIKRPDPPPVFSAETVKASWLEEAIVTPLRRARAAPIILILDSLGGTNGQLTLIATKLATAVLMRKDVDLKIFLTTSPETRSVSSTTPEPSLFIEEIHVLYPLSTLMVPSYLRVRQRTLAALGHHNSGDHARLYLHPLNLFQPISTTWEASGSPIGSFLESIRLFLRLDLLQRQLNDDEDLGMVLKQKIEADYAKDILILADQLRSVVSDATSTSMARRLRGDSAQTFVDYAQLLVDDGHMQELFGYDWDKKARRLIISVSTAADKMPSSLFLKEAPVLKSTEPYASGGYADIYRGKVNGKNVAIKRIRVWPNQSGFESLNKKFAREALTWAPLKHPNVTPFSGIDHLTFAPSLCLVSPWMKNGSLKDYRERHGPRRTDIFGLACQIVDGLEYLHFSDIIHGDLRSDNILIDDQGKACLTDFGLARFSEATMGSNSGTANQRFLAPELFLYDMENDASGRKTKESDVFGFACTMIELYTGQPPLHELRTGQAVVLKYTQGLRPPRPQNSGISVAMSDMLWDLVQRCWHGNPQERPSMAQVKSTIRIAHPRRSRTLP